MLSIPSSLSAWRPTFQAMQQSFRQAAEAYPNLRHAILQALDGEGTLPPSLEDEMREAGVRESCGVVGKFLWGNGGRTTLKSLTWTGGREIARQNSATCSATQLA